MKRNYRQAIRLLTAAVLGTMGFILVSCSPSDDSGDAQAASEQVAKIGDDAITKDELKQRLAQEIRPQRDEYGVSTGPVTPQSVLRTMLAEKAMVMEARKLGYLEDEALRSSIEKYRQRLLVNLFANDYVMENVPVPEPNVAEQLQTDPNLTREQAEMKVRAQNAKPILNQFYVDLQQKLKLEKVKDNFPKAASIHQRLLLRPAQPRGGTIFWIMNKQVRDELSDAEKAMVLARYTGGEFTLHDWFNALTSMAPPGRPKDLGRPAGVERLLDRALPSVLWAAEAVARGYDKNPELLRQIKTREDMQLLGKIKGQKYREVQDPNADEIKAYFEAHEDLFADSAFLNVEQIWCPDLQTAQKAHKLLVDGDSLESVNEAHGLLEQSKPHNVYPSSEGPFWDDLWKAEPNDVVGPLKGFYQTGIKWRVLRVLEKTPPVLKPYSKSLENQVKSALMTQRRQDIFAAYEAQLLQKYPHTIYADRIEDIDPLEVTPVEQPPQ